MSILINLRNMLACDYEWAVLCGAMAKTLAPTSISRKMRGSR